MTSTQNLAVSPVFTSPRFELFSRSGDDGNFTIVKKLPIYYQNDPSRVRQFCNEQNFLATLGTSYFEYKSQSFCNNSPVEFEFTTRSTYSLATLIQSTSTQADYLPISVRAALFKQILNAVMLHRNIPGVDGVWDHFFEFTPTSLFFGMDGHLLFSHVNFELPPADQNAISRESGFEYFYYAAPEQFVTGQRISSNALLYTLGIVFFEILTGKNLFNTNRHSNRNSLLDRKIRHLHPYVSDVCPEFEFADKQIHELLQPVPGRRHLDIVALQEILDKLHVCAQASDDISVLDYTGMLSERNKTSEAKDITEEDAEQVLFQVSDIAELNDS